MDKEINGLVVVAKKVVKGKSHFFTGGIKAGKFVRYREIKTLGALKHADDYVTLAKYLKSIGATGQEAEILAGLGVEKLYVRQTVKAEPGTQEKTKGKGKVSKASRQVTLKGTPAADEKIFWAKFHPTCIPCTKTCKQSHMALAVYCPSRVTK